jgi:hypothetical protein
MIFNEVWTKEKNDMLRQMIREKKSVDEIKKYFGSDLDYHPTKKYDNSKILPFRKFLNEIVFNPKYTHYGHKFEKSIFLSDKEDIIIDFKSDKECYNLILFYFIDKGIHSYNIVFTLQKQYEKYSKELENIIKNKKYGETLTDSEHKYLSDILEQETQLNEPIQIMNKLSFILFDIYPKLNNTLLSIGETKRKIKIDFYRDVIKSSFKNVEEIKDVDSSNQIIYYYKIIK